MNKLEIEIVDSFVKAVIKNQGTKGSGEAKLHIGSSKDVKLNEFFNNFKNITCYFDKKNLTNFIDEIKKNYINLIPVEKSEKVLLKHLNKKLKEIETLNKKEDFNITAYTDESRFYIRSENEIFNNIFREIAIPYISKLIIHKENNSFYFELIFNQDALKKNKINRNIQQFKNFLYKGNK